MLMVNHLIGFGAGGGFGSPTTIWSATLGTDGSGWENYSVRNLAESLSGGGTQVRVRFVASAAASLTLDHASVGIRTSNADTSATPVELLFSGASGFTITAGNTLTSDWADLTFLSSDTLVITCDVAASNGNPKVTSGGSTNMYARSAFDSYNQSSVSSFSLNTPGGFRTVAINQIEARSAL